MYLFEAHYIDNLSRVDIIKEIEFEAQFFLTEKERYLYAMGRAHDLAREEEQFISLEFISC